MAVDRRAWWAGGLAAVVIGGVVWTLAGEGSDSPATRAAAASQARRVTARAPMDAPAGVRLDRLVADTAGGMAADEARRNPFQFRGRQAAPSPAFAPAPPAPGVFAPPPAAGPAAAAPITLKFIGIVESGDGLRLAVLSDGRVVSHGQEGDIIDGRYRILKIGVESIEVASLDGRGQHTIRLSGQ